MKSFLLLLGLVMGVALAQRDGGSDGERMCTMDGFDVISRTGCRRECLTFDNVTRCVTGCNMTCNQTMTTPDNCPSLERCTLACIRERDEETGCEECECREIDPDDGFDRCRVNFTTFTNRTQCKLRCVVRRDEDDCFMCNMTCNATTTPDLMNECAIRDSDTDRLRECPDNEVCIFNGFVNRCVSRPGSGEQCEREDPVDTDGDETSDDLEEDLEDDDVDFYTRVEGATDRLRTYSLSRSAELEIPCADGYRCLEGTCNQITGPCIVRRANDTQVDCRDDGNFNPLQCRRMDDGSHTCYCVHLRNGSRIAGTMRTGIRDRDDVPDCDSRVFRRCYYQQGGRNFTVRHNDIFVNLSTCVRCRCNDGRGDDCVRDTTVDCGSLNPGNNPSDCTRGDVTIRNGARRMIGKCNMCGCNNGRLTCTDIDDCRDDDEDRDEDETRCERCQDAPTRLVCGRDRVTYRSLCTAINCSRLRDSDILKDGPCTNQPVCSLFPCGRGFVCIPLGGRTCLRNEGCTDDEWRLCVNRTQLSCRVANVTRDGFSTSDEDVVCGSDRRTYRSFCHMIQQAPANTKVAHAGRCDKEECNSGRVCGTDGVTYNSTCHLRAQSANAQADYKGMCVDDDEASTQREICRTVRDEEKRCDNDGETCERRVLSRDGCCPICGGITTLAIDGDALDEYSRATGSDANLDEFMARMTRDDVIPEDVRRRCVIEATRVRTSVQTNIEVKLMARDRQADADFCYTSSMDLADKINGDGTTDATTVSTLPVETSFASAAAAAPLIADEPGAAPGLMASGFAVLVAALMAVFF